MSGKYLATAVAGMLAMMGSAAQAQTLPPVAGSTMEYQDGISLISLEAEDAGIDLLLNACDSADAAACAELAQIKTETFARVLSKRRNATQAAFARQAVKLLRRRCSPTDDADNACETYSVVLWEFSNRGVHVELVVEGGKLLAGRCLAGKNTPDTCAIVERYLQTEPTELAALENSVGRGFEHACANGDSDMCKRGFYRKISPGVSEKLAVRLLRLAQAAENGCSEGSPLICVEAGLFLYEFGNADARAYAAEFFNAACQLPANAGERDVRQGSCDFEKSFERNWPTANEATLH